MIFQPEPGVYEKVHQIDFTSLYPGIMVKYNLSPETIEHPERTGFLASVLSSLLNLRIETKRLKEDKQGLRRHRFGPEVDACYVFRLHRL
jgi:DNA polymerase I